jgi:hypothetical protein
MRWARKHKVLAALLPGLGLILAIGITVSTIGAARPAGAGRPGGLASAPEAAPATRGARWLAGPAGRLLEAVIADAGRLSAGERAGERGRARIAGPRLAAAARAALSGPMPPADAKIYRSALREFEIAGIYLGRGEFSKADTLLNAGDNDITKVTSAVNNPAESSAQAAVKEPKRTVRRAGG